MTRIAIAVLSFAALAAGSAAQAQGAVYPVRPAYPATGVTPGVGTNTGNIAAHKQNELAKIQQKMQILQQLQSCVSAASTTDAIRQCNETARSERGTTQKKC